MGWQCKLCESLNTDETAVCEVCNGIAPFMACFHDDYIDSVHALIVWQIENALQIIVKYEGKTYDVTSWKKAKIRLVTNITFLSFILKNEVAERVYSFGIPSDKI